jgi:hypothetical protein
MTYDVGNPGPGLGKAQTRGGGIKPNNGIPTLRKGTNTWWH